MAEAREQANAEAHLVGYFRRANLVIQLEVLPTDQTVQHMERSRIGKRDLGAAWLPLSKQRAIAKCCARLVPRAGIDAIIIPFSEPAYSRFVAHFQDPWIHLLSEVDE
eukprot:7378877-Prymnesium_polylepis.2